MGILFIIIGLALYVLYLFNKTDKNKKTYGGKFIIRGIAAIIISILIIISYMMIGSAYCKVDDCSLHSYFSF